MAAANSQGLDGSGRDRKKFLGRGFQFPLSWLGAVRTPGLLESTSETNAERLKNSPWAYACLRAFTDVVPSVEFVAQEWQEVEQNWVRNRNHEVEERFDDPNPYQSQNDLVSTNITDLICAGNALTNIMDSPRATKGKPNTLPLSLS